MKLKVLESQFRGRQIEVKLKSSGFFRYVINGLEDPQDFNRPDYTLMEAKRKIIERDKKRKNQ